MAAVATNVQRSNIAELMDGRSTIELSKITSPCGERLEIYSPEKDASLRLDPLALESLSWQDGDSLSNTIGEPDELEIGEPVSETSFDDVRYREDPIEFSNEYTKVVVSLYESAAGDGIEVRSKQLGYSIKVSPSTLDYLAGNDYDIFSGFLSEPFGPLD